MSFLLGVFVSIHPAMETTTERRKRELGLDVGLGVGLGLGLRLGLVVGLGLGLSLGLGRGPMDDKSSVG